ncbi:MAG TPA: hypothetical protein VKG62_02670, partial [Solirubrobacteraceae bacterium]|nr:hypothetical protein [Solirubrobacteraceae bacterium]
WTFLTVAADTAAPLTLLGAPSAATGGYSGTDRTLTGSSLARLVRRHEARYVILGGIYSTRGGNSATRSVLKACRLIAPSVWKSPKVHEEMLYLFDCAGHEAALQKG